MHADAGKTQLGDFPDEWLIDTRQIAGHHPGYA
jgi:hypothetical protein